MGWDARSTAVRGGTGGWGATGDRAPERMGQLRGDSRQRQVPRSVGRQGSTVAGTAARGDPGAERERAMERCGVRNASTGIDVTKSTSGRKTRPAPEGPETHLNRGQVRGLERDRGQVTGEGAPGKKTPAPTQDKAKGREKSEPKSRGQNHGHKKRRQKKDMQTRTMREARSRETQGQGESTAKCGTPKGTTSAQETNEKRRKQYN